jgi:DNA-binding transcriptional MocR family regulator
MYVCDPIRKVEERRVSVKQLARAHHGKILQGGQNVNFVYVNARHHNPLRRVVPIDVY